jgi:hypothetical protein
VLDRIRKVLNVQKRQSVCGKYRDTIANLYESFGNETVV